MYYGIIFRFLERSVEAQRVRKKAILLDRVDGIS